MFTNKICDHCTEKKNVLKMDLQQGLNHAHGNNLLKLYIYVKRGALLMVSLIVVISEDLRACALLSLGVLGIITQKSKGPIL